MAKNFSGPINFHDIKAESGAFVGYTLTWGHLLSVWLEGLTSLVWASVSSPEMWRRWVKSMLSHLSSQSDLYEFGSLGQKVILLRPPHWSAVPSPLPGPLAGHHGCIIDGFASINSHILSHLLTSINSQNQVAAACDCEGGRMGLETFSQQHFHQLPILEWCSAVLGSSIGKLLVQFPLTFQQ